MRLIFLLLASVPLFGQGWTQLTGTTFVSGSVCVPNSFNSGTYTTGSFGWADQCFNMVGNWNGAIADTKRNRLIMWGMGHVETPGNELYSLDLVIASPNAKGTSNGSSVPAIRRLNDPSNPRDYPDNSVTQYITNADGTPISRHTYGSMVYLPKSDRMLAWGGQEWDGVYAQSRNLWLLHMADDMSTVAGCGSPSVAPCWEARVPSGFLASQPFGGVIFANCVLDTTQISDEAVFCIGGNGGNNYLWHYNITSDTWTTKVPFGGWTVGGTLQVEGVPVVDPDRRMIYHIGFGSNGGLGAKMYSIMMDSPYTSADLTSTVTGCSALMGAKFPGLIYDPSLNRIVGYPNTGNTVYIFDPATMTCVGQTFTGGPTGSTQTTSNGLFGRFNYFPALGKYVVVNNHAANAYTLQINNTPKHGLGATADLTSPTPRYTCVDRDGDGYGTGPGCTGPDADDQDAAVHAGGEFVTKWTTLAAGLNHLGYSPTNIYYLATTGTDAGSPPNCKNNAAAPCLTWAHIASSVAAGDAVVLRGGTYSFLITPPTGTAGSPVIIMSYPGELATFATSGTGIRALNKSWLVIDGVKLNGTQPSGGGIAELGSYPYDLTTSHNIILRHIESTNNKWGLVIDTSAENTVEDCVLYANNAGGGGEHGLYSANHDGYLSGNVSTNYSTNLFVRRTLAYNNPFTGFHVNGRYSNVIIDQGIVYNNSVSGDGAAGIQLQTGVKNSIIRDTVSINNRTGIGFDSYQGWCDAFDTTHTCPYGQNGNLIQNFTHYATGKDLDGTDWPAGFASIMTTNSSSTTVNQGSLTVRNAVMANNHIPGFGYADIHFDAASAADASTSTFTNNRVWNSNATPGTAAFSIGTTFYTCAQGVSGSGSTFGSVANCSFGDPGFTAASTSYYNAPASFDLQLRATSPAVAAGLGALAYDVLGNPHSPTAPSIGAYEYQGAPAAPPGTGGSKVGGKMTHGGKIKR